MIVPDLRGCPEHGHEDMGFWWVKTDGNGPKPKPVEPYKRFYCRVCRRLAASYRQRYPKGRGRVRSYNGTHCVNGHLKTPWTWMVEGGRSRCVTCRRERQRRKRAA